MSTATADEVKILRYAVKALSTQLNDLIQDCTDASNQLRAPSRKVYMQSRACLPGQYTMTLKKKSDGN